MQSVYIVVSSIEETILYKYTCLITKCNYYTSSRKLSAIDGYYYKTLFVFLLNYNNGFSFANNLRFFVIKQKVVN